MFVLKSLGRLILGNTEQKELLELPGGTFWRVIIDSKTNIVASRSQYFGDKKNSAVLTLQRGDEPFTFELVASVKDENDDQVNESKPFPLSESLSFTRSRNKAGETFFYWHQQEEPNVFWEFVMNREGTSQTTIEMFQMTAAQCIFEAENRRSQGNASDAEIKRYLVNDIPEDTNSTDDKVSSDKFKVAEELIVFKSDVAGFYVFDSNSNLFVPRQAQVNAVIVRDVKKPFEYWLYVCTTGQVDSGTIIHKQRIDPDATQHVDRPSGSFIWCFFSENGYIWTFSIKFAEMTDLLAFSNAYGQAVYEVLNHEKFSKVAKEDVDFLMNPFMDVEMKDALPLSIEDESESEPESEAEGSEEEIVEESDWKFGDRDASNQMLAVGFKTDRSFVSRGTGIGVFKHTEDDRLQFVADAKVKTGKGESFNPSKMMLHQEDRSLLLMNPGNQHSIYRMDLERGKIVDEWRVHDEARITSMIPDSKYAQMTGNETFIGLNANSIFRVDPRLAGNKRVDAEMKQYVVKNEFSCGATTGSGELAVASAKGEIRLFNKLDKRAKTLLPMFGDPIIGVDVTESGKFILATCKTYLLLIDAELESDPGVFGFTKSLGSTKPIPKRLQLKPEHIAYMGSQPSFTPARFSTGPSEERSIITSTGPFVITWNLRRVKQGHLHDYQIKKYQDKIVADNFRFGQDKSIVVALPKQVTLISKKSMQAPSPKALRGGRNIVEEYAYTGSPRRK